MPRYTDTTDATVEDFEEVARMLQYFAKRYLDLCDKLREQEIEVVAARNTRSLRLGIDNIEKHLQRAYETVDAMVRSKSQLASTRPSGLISDLIPEDLLSERDEQLAQDLAEEAKRKTKSIRKKAAKKSRKKKT